MTPDIAPRRWTFEQIVGQSRMSDELRGHWIEAHEYDAIEAELQRERRKVEKLRECAEFYKPGEFPWSADSEFDNGQFAEETLAELEAIDKGEG